MKLKLRFHPAVSVPVEFKEELVMQVKPELSLRELQRDIERFFEIDPERLITARVTALFNSKRDQALPSHENVSEHFQDGDVVVILGDVRRSRRSVVHYPEDVPMHMTRRGSIVKDVESGKRHSIVEDVHHTVVGPAVPLPAGPPKKIPVTILTGFLGSGKTTMLNHLLQEQRSKKIAVIENEFGEVPIDNELLTSKLSTAEQVVVMENGCMCCSVRGDILGAFSSVLDRVKAGNHLDSVLIETTGMADPVPIVRTLLKTPIIEENFDLTGVITLVDAKNILGRLREMDLEDQDKGEVDEAFQQIMYADRIILNKIDLVPTDVVVEVWNRLRGINHNAHILTCTRGKVDPADLADFHSRDMTKVADETEEEMAMEEDHDCCDGHDHDHDHGHDHAHNHDENCEHEHGHGHSHSQHNKQIGSFSLIRDGMEVDGIKFARWVRRLAMIKKEEVGTLYRCKAVLALAGSPYKLVFHAVADVMEKTLVGQWQQGETRGCKIVFIGKKLRREFFEESFDACLRRVRPPMCTTPVPEGNTLLGVHSGAEKNAFYRIVQYLDSRDAARLGMTCRQMYDAVFGPKAIRRLQALGSKYGYHGAFHKRIHLHNHLPMCAVGEYVTAVKRANVEVVPYPGLFFNSPDAVEAAGITWLDLAEQEDKTSNHFVVEFGWRKETLKTFFAAPGNNTQSALVKVEVPGAKETEWDDDVTDTLKFRVELKYEPTATDPPMEQHRMNIYLVGGKVSSQVYRVSFHSINPNYQVHVPVPDHRIPFYPTKEVFHQWHPLMQGLRREPKLRFLIRVKPDGSGPLGEMCGCC
eukprot:comp21078_c0_seq1/m.28394 comp21078_c0_seq1/g.28394  ORF comp21078_c0_seq1/g.28394 comp21078_c0_seq1/m.28394 type:complete len:810 (-) comp21078_c0_seq1:43-2472(-)